ncbi:MAG: DUF4333 domain-containing protein [Actinomycetota bacterium]
MRSRPRIGRAATLAALVLVSASCSRPLDTGGLESDLKAQIEDKLGAEDLSVTCPDGVKAEAGSSFTCEASDPTGATMVITVTQNDDQGRVTWTVTGAST